MIKKMSCHDCAFNLSKDSLTVHAHEHALAQSLSASFLGMESAPQDGKLFSKGVGRADVCFANSDWQLAVS